MNTETITYRISFERAISLYLVLNSVKICLVLWGLPGWCPRTMIHCNDLSWINSLPNGSQNELIMLIGDSKVSHKRTFILRCQGQTISWSEKGLKIELYFLRMYNNSLVTFVQNTIKCINKRKSKLSLFLSRNDTSADYIF